LPEKQGFLRIFDELQNTWHDLSYVRGGVIKTAGVIGGVEEMGVNMTASNGFSVLIITIDSY
jgi:hypothetical protein